MSWKFNGRSWQKNLRRFRRKYRKIRKPINRNVKYEQGGTSKVELPGNIKFKIDVRKLAASARRRNLKGMGLDRFDLDELRAKYFFDDICIYLDNLSVHVSKEMKERMDELSIAYVYSPIYSPDLNPVEYVFSMVK